MKEVSIALTGDSFITQRLPRDSKFAALQNFLGHMMCVSLTLKFCCMTLMYIPLL